MPDLLTHVLLAYAAVAVATRYVGRLGPEHAPVAMVGSAMPDLAKASLVIDPLLGASTEPYLLALHRLGGVVVLAGIGALLVGRAERRLAFGLLLAGGLVHLGLDAFVIRADGLAPPYLYPLTWWRPPAGDVYLSSDVWPAAVAVAIAGGAMVICRRVDRRRDAGAS